MSDPILADIASQMKRMESEIARAQQLVAIAEEAGENMAEAKAKLRQAEERRLKWRDTLKARGYDI